MKAIYTEGSDGKKVVVVGLVPDDVKRMLDGSAPVAPFHNISIVLVVRDTEGELDAWMERAGCVVLGCGPTHAHLN